MLSFKVGVEDASYLQNEFAPIFSQNDLINLENFNAYIKLLVNGEYPPPFSMSTFYDSVKPTIIAGTEYPVNERTFRNIKELSRLRYGRDRNAVDQEIQGRGRM